MSKPLSDERLNELLECLKGPNPFSLGLTPSEILSMLAEIESSRKEIPLARAEHDTALTRLVISTRNLITESGAMTMEHTYEWDAYQAFLHPLPTPAEIRGIDPGGSTAEHLRDVREESDVRR